MAVLLSRQLLFTAAGGAAAGLELLTVRSHRLDPEGSGSPILHRASGDGQPGAEAEISWTDFVSDQRGGAFRLEAPRGHRAVLVGDIHQQPGVWIGELKLLHHALESDFLLILEHDTGVMRFDKQGRQHQERRTKNGDESNSAHRGGSLELSLSVKVRSL